MMVTWTKLSHPEHGNSMYIPNITKKTTPTTLVNTKRWPPFEHLIDMKHFLHKPIPVLYGASCHYCIRGSSGMDPHTLNLRTRHKCSPSCPCNCTPSTESTGSCVSHIACPHALLSPEVQVRHVHLCLCIVTFELHPIPPSWDHTNTPLATREVLTLAHGKTAFASNKGLGQIWCIGITT
jgi:hypothetical protein